MALRRSRLRALMRPRSRPLRSIRRAICIARIGMGRAVSVSSLCRWPTHGGSPPACCRANSPAVTRSVPMRMPAHTMWCGRKTNSPMIEEIVKALHGVDRAAIVAALLLPPEQRQALVAALLSVPAPVGNGAWTHQVAIEPTPGPFVAVSPELTEHAEIDTAELVRQRAEIAQMAGPLPPVDTTIPVVPLVERVTTESFVASPGPPITQETPNEAQDTPEARARLLAVL